MARAQIHELRHHSRCAKINGDSKTVSRFEIKARVIRKYHMFPLAHLDDQITFRALTAGQAPTVGNFVRMKQIALMVARRREIPSDSHSASSATTVATTGKLDAERIQDVPQGRARRHRNYAPKRLELNPSHAPITERLSYKSTQLIRI